MKKPCLYFFWTNGQISTKIAQIYHWENLNRLDFCDLALNFHCPHGDRVLLLYEVSGEQMFSGIIQQFLEKAPGLNWGKLST